MKKLTPEARDNLLANRREYWRDQGLCSKAAEVQADFEWDEVEAEIVQATADDGLYS